MTRRLLPALLIIPAVWLLLLVWLVAVGAYDERECRCSAT